MNSQCKYLLATPFIVFLYVLLAAPANAYAQNSLVNMKTNLLPGNRAEITLEFSETPEIASNFSLSDPSRIIFDFAQTNNKISKKQTESLLNMGIVNNTSFIENEDNLRFIVEVKRIIPFETNIVDNRVIIVLSEAEAIKSGIKRVASIDAIDFRRGDSSEGRLIINLGNNSMPIDFREDKDDVIIEFKDTDIGEHLVRKFDVTDFGTPIKNVRVSKEDDNVLVRLSIDGSFEKIAYQVDNEYIFEARPLNQQELEASKSKRFKFTGEKISLNFQDIAVRSILQILAEFTGLNIVASDSVSGNVSLKLSNVPWDQALDFILKSKGLGKRESGNIVLIAPNEELIAREQLELEALQQNETLAQLKTEFIQVNFAQATAIADILKSEENSILSSRGQISVDERTNVLLVKDTFDKIVEIKDILEKLDVPVKQVLIEAQIVETSDSFTESFGIGLGGSSKMQIGKYTLGIGGRPPASSSSSGETSTTGTTNTDGGSSKPTTPAGFANSIIGNDVTNRGIFSDILSASAKGTFGFALARLPGGTLLDLELRASELESKSKTISRPRVVTQDQQTAVIEQGKEIPYVTISQGGATPTTTFKKATLKLEATPQITANDKISLELKISQDRPNSADFGGQTGVDTVTSDTTILVSNGETIVLGGVFTDSQGTTTERIPYLSKIPLLGKAFSGDRRNTTRAELLIFVTPRILQGVS